MQLRFVGCGDALGSGGRFNTCFHVTGASVNFLIDCGASSLPALKRLGIARDDIDLILITHFHGDHFGGLPFLLLDAQFTRRTRPLVIAGPDGIETKLANLMEALFEHSSKTKQRFDLSVVALEAGAEPDFRRGQGDAVSGRPRQIRRAVSGLSHRGRGARHHLQRRYRMDGYADPGGARRGPVHCRGLLLRQDRQEPSQPEDAGSAPARDQRQTAGADAYERRHARDGWANCPTRPPHDGMVVEL